MATCYYAGLAFLLLPLMVVSAIDAIKLCCPQNNNAAAAAPAPPADNAPSADDLISLDDDSVSTY